MELARIQECVRAGLAACIGLQLGMRASHYNDRRNWDECRFNMGALVGCFAALGAMSVYLTQPPSACYRLVGIVDFAAATVLLTVASSMALAHPVDRVVSLGLGGVYALYGTYRILRQFDEILAQTIGWCGTLAYAALMLWLAYQALAEWLQD